MKMKRTVVKSKGFSATPKASHASKVHAQQPKSKAIKLPKGGRGGSSHPARCD
jgi:hypothetical protein